MAAVSLMAAAGTSVTIPTRERHLEALRLIGIAVERPVALEFTSLAKYVRKSILEMAMLAGTCHIGGAYSMVEIVGSLLVDVMERYPRKSEVGDRLVVSKGHCVVALYAWLAVLGITAFEELSTFNALGTALPSHPDMRKNPWMHFSSGSLGQGISAAAGMAWGLRRSSQHKVFVIVGDGELQEGQVWEALMLSTQLNLTNLCVIVDRNGLQTADPTSVVVGVEPLTAKLAAFGFDASVIDGHDRKALSMSFNYFYRGDNRRPVAIVADTRKGFGSSILEDSPRFHGSSLSDEDYTHIRSDLYA